MFFKTRRQVEELRNNVKTQGEAQIYSIATTAAWVEALKEAVDALQQKSGMSANESRERLDELFADRWKEMIKSIEANAPDLAAALEERHKAEGN